jgi:hypothetical protein
MEERASSSSIFRAGCVLTKNIGWRSIVSLLKTTSACPLISKCHCSVAFEVRTSTTTKSTAASASTSSEVCACAATAWCSPERHFDCCDAIVQFSRKRHEAFYFST